MRRCFLFPGQGAQYPGMGRDIYERSARVRELFELASDLTSKDLRALLFDGTEEDLKSTDNTQAAITLVNISSSTVLAECGIVPGGTAGFSLGEYSALWQAKVLGIEDLFRIIRLRGDIMDRAARDLDSKGTKTGMTAVLGLDFEECAEIIERMKGRIFLANHNSPTQIVVGGAGTDLEQAARLFIEAGAMKTVPLKVSGPFHTPLMIEARREFEAALDSYGFSDPAIDIFMNVTGKKAKKGGEIKRLCGMQIVSTVRWVAAEREILTCGYEQVIETGPGRVLRGLWRSVEKSVPCMPADTCENIDKLA